MFDRGTDAQVLVLLLMIPFNALLSAVVANVDLAPRADEPREWNMWTFVRKQYFKAPLLDGVEALRHRACAIDAMLSRRWTWLMVCPCVWCCCPQLLVLWLLASNVNPSAAKERWLDMFSFVTGLAGSIVSSGLVVTAIDCAAAALGVEGHWGFVMVGAGVACLLTALVVLTLEPLVPSCAAPRLPVAEPVYAAETVYGQVRESTVLAVDNAKHAVGMA